MDEKKIRENHVFKNVYISSHYEQSFTTLKHTSFIFLLFSLKILRNFSSTTDCSRCMALLEWLVCEGGGRWDTQEGVGIFIVLRLRQKGGGEEWGWVGGWIKELFKATSELRQTDSLSSLDFVLMNLQIKSWLAERNCCCRWQTEGLDDLMSYMWVFICFVLYCLVT